MRLLITMRYVLACWLVFLCVPAWAVMPQTLHFDRLSLEQGLSSASVTTVLQDRQGFMWIGTPAGLNRFDGYRFTLYKNDPHNAASLSDNWVTALLEDAQGRLWVGTRSGLQHYDPIQDAFVNHVPDKSNLSKVHAQFHVTAMVGEWPGNKEKKNGVWLATNDGLKHFNADTNRFDLWHHDASSADSLYSDRVNALAWDASGNLWIGRTKGVDRLVTGTNRFDHFGTDDSTVFSLLFGTDNTLWVGTRSGLEAWDLSKPVPARHRVTFDGNDLGWVLSLMQDRDGAVWAGTESNGLYRRVSPATDFTLYKREPKDTHSLASNSIYSLHQDRNGSLWIGTWTGGVNLTDLASGGFSRYDHLVGDPTSMDDDRINAVMTDATNRLWLGTADGLAQLDPKSGGLVVFRHDDANPKSLPNNWIQTVFIARNKQMWVGTKEGLASFDPDTKAFTNHRFSERENLANWVYDVLEDDEGALWVATLAGLYRFDPATNAVQGFRHKQDERQSLVDDRVTTLLRDKKGNFWVGTLSGLDQMNIETGRFTHVRHDVNDPFSLSGNGIINLHEDKKGHFWIATTSGLNRLDAIVGGRFRFHNYTSQDGIYGEPVGSILEDPKGRIWITTTRGVSRLEPDTGHVKNFTARDGLLNGASLWCSGAIGSDGTFYFGTSIGLTAFKPDEIRENPTPPLVAITELQVFNRTVRGTKRPQGVAFDGAISTAKTLTLSHDNSVFSLEFSALHYSDPSRNQYAYQLVGFDRDWVITDAARRLATYTNLDPGHYIFRVKASNNSGVWSESDATLEITITPPFWKTWWFRLLFVMTVLGLSWIAYRTRVRSLTKQKELLELQVTSRTAEVVQQKNLLEQEKLEVLAQKHEVERQRSETERQKERVEQAHDNISRLSEIGREITATLDRQKIIDSVHRYVHQLMYVDGLSIGIFREMQRVIEFPFCEEHGKRVQQDNRSMDDLNQVTVWCIAHRKEIFISDINTEPHAVANGEGDVPGVDILQDGAVPASRLSIICVPMLVKDRVLGVIRVNAARSDSYRRVHLDMMMSLAAYAGVALDNADAYRQLQETQEQLIAQEKMAALGLMVAGVAHELNTPIGNSLLIATAMLDEADNVAAKLDKQSILRSDLTTFFSKAKESSILIVRGLSSAANLVNSFKQVAVDRTTEQRRVFDLRQVSQEIVATMTSRFKKSGHTLALDIPEGIAMNSYPGPYGQVITNCINNALLHAFEDREGGQMVLSARQTDGRVQIQFSDNGKGISEAHLKRIFDPFFTTKLGQGGNGLGLSISFNIVNSLLNGQISVRSVLGEGTIFTFDLPLVVVEAGK